MSLDWRAYNLLSLVDHLFNWLSYVEFSSQEVRCISVISVILRVVRFSYVISVDLVLYKLIKVDILIICFLPLCCWCFYLVPLVLLYSFTFLQDVELHHGRWPWIWLVTFRPCQWFRRLHLWRQIAEAKHSSILKTTELKPGQYIFAAHPHGVLPLGICLNIGTNATNIDQLFPGIVFRGVAVSACYIIPIYRDLCLAVGGTDCRESTIRSLLLNGYSPVVVPGGADESLLSVSHHNHILMRHKGFIRLAMQTGTPIVPMWIWTYLFMYRYSFGENNWWDIPEDRKPLPWLNFLTKRVEWLIL